jgi:hypothetical protein
MIFSLSMSFVQKMTENRFLPTDFCQALSLFFFAKCGYDTNLQG